MPMIYITNKTKQKLEEINPKEKGGHNKAIENLIEGFSLLYQVLSTYDLKPMPDKILQNKLIELDSIGRLL